jgi:hypothetical protein
MIIKIRTKDNLVELLKNGITYSWKISQWRLDHIKEVHIYDFSGKAKIKGNFDIKNTKLLENGRVAIAFNNAVIEPSDYSWVGQNPIKFESNSIEVELSEEENEVNNNSNDSNSNLPNDKYEMIDWDKANDIAKTINPLVFQRISSFFDSKDYENFSAQLNENNCLRIISKFPKADITSEYWLELNLSGLEFYFRNQNTGLYLEVLNEFDDFNSYFELDYDYGTAIAKLLNQKYNEVFESRIDSGDDLELDEDFKLYFIDNFVNYILNDVFLDE